MGSDGIHHGPISIENASSGESNNVDSLEVVSSAGDATRELQSAAEILSRVGLDLACTSEKLVNLEILFLHVGSRENDFEAFDTEEVHAPQGSAERALEFDLLYGMLDSQVREVEGFISDLDSEITSSRELISSFKQLGYVMRELEEKLQDCENSLKLSIEQVSDIKTNSNYFQRILLASSRDENWVDNKELSGLGNNNGSNLNVKIKMQTAEQQRDILKMLEKSLAREMDLEKKLSDSRQTEEALKFQLQQEVSCMEEEAEEMWERLFEAEYSAQILWGISKELAGQLQTAQFSIIGLAQREMDLRSKLQDLTEQWQEKDCDLRVSEIARTELVEKKVRSLEQSNKDLELKATEAEKRADIFESECKPLRESNMELNKDMICLKSSIAVASETVELLKRQLKETELERLHATATAEASQENETMLKCTIKDMENLIKELKSRVVKAESQTESAEDKCIILSESNMDLVEEVRFLRHKIEYLESSLHRADEAKKETAIDIRVQTKLITDLVVQLALERERLCKQISSFAKQQKVAAKKLQRIKKPSVTVIGSHDAKEKKHKLTEKGSKNEISSKESNKKAMGSSATRDETANEHRDSSSTAETKTCDADSTSELNTVRNIDARQLGFKSVLIMVLIALVIPAFAAFLIHGSGVQT